MLWLVSFLLTIVGIFAEYSLSEYHLENDISVAQYQYYAATQNKTWLQNKGWPLLSSIAEFWASQVVSNSSTGLYDTLNESQYLKSALISSADYPLADPDEYANYKNNAAYTNAGISVIMKNAIELAGVLGLSVPKNWSTIGDKVTVLADNSSGIILEYGEILILYGFGIFGWRAVDGFNGTTAVKQADVVVSYTQLHS